MSSSVKKSYSVSIFQNNYTRLKLKRACKRVTFKWCQCNTVLGVHHFGSTLLHNSHIFYNTFENYSEQNYGTRIDFNFIASKKCMWSTSKKSWNNFISWGSMGNRGTSQHWLHTRPTTTEPKTPQNRRCEGLCFVLRISLEKLQRSNDTIYVNMHLLLIK